MSGRLPPEIIRKIVRNHHGYIRKCYGARARAPAGLAGEGGSSSPIARDGLERRGDGQSAPDCKAAHCIRDVFKTLRFPKPEGGEVTVQYPIVLGAG